MYIVRSIYNLEVCIIRCIYLEVYLIRSKYLEVYIIRSLYNKMYIFRSIQRSSNPNLEPFGANQRQQIPIEIV